MSLEFNINCVKTKTPKHSSNKILDVYDNIFTYAEINRLADFISNSFFKIDGTDRYSIPLEMQTYSPYSEEDVLNMGFYNTNAFKHLSEKYQLQEMTCVRRRVNLTTPSEKNRPHIDANGLSLLYYANPVWEVAWGGHTLFMNDLLTDAEYTCLCRPNRLIVFDGTIPHMILTPSNLCPTFRTSFILQYSR